MNVLFWHKADSQFSEKMGGGNRIVACNHCHKLIYVFPIFNVPANVPADLLDAIGLLWMLLYLLVSALRPY